MLPAWRTSPQSGCSLILVGLGVLIVGWDRGDLLRAGGTSVEVVKVALGAVRSIALDWDAGIVPPWRRRALPPRHPHQPPHRPRVRSPSSVQVAGAVCHPGVTR